MIGPSRRLDTLAGLWAPLLVGTVVRVWFLSRMEGGWADAYGYAWNGRAILEGSWESVERLTYTFFSLVIAAVTPIVGDAVRAGEIVSLVAGIATLPVVYALALRVADRRAAAVACWVTALHPRLVEFSTVGYTEALLTLLVAGGLLLGVLHLTAHSEGSDSESLTARYGDLGSLGLFALAFLVRNDTLFYLPLALAVHAAADLRLTGPGRAIRATLRRIAVTALVIAPPTAVAWVGMGESPLFKKAGANLALGALYDVERLDEWRSRLYQVDESGKFTFFETPPPKVTLRDRARIYLANVANMSRFYGMRFLFSPLLLAFAAVGLLGTVLRRGTWAAEALLLGAWLAPHALYPLAIIQPQYLAQTLPVLAVWAGRGVARFMDLVGETTRLEVAGDPSAPSDSRAGAAARRVSLAAGALAVLLILLPLAAPIAPLQAKRAEMRGPTARYAGTRLARFLDEDDRFLGSDGGMSYYSHHNDRRPLPIGVDAAGLARVARANDARFVVLTSRDVPRDVAPLLAPEAPAVDGLRRVFRGVDPHGIVVAIFEVDPAGSPPAAGR